MKKFIQIGSLIISAAAASAAYAQNAPASDKIGQDSHAMGQKGAAGTVEFSTLDTDKDGKLSASEARINTGLTASFKRLDTDSDTYLSRTEFGKWDDANKPASAVAPRPMTPDRDKSDADTMPDAPRAPSDSSAPRAPDGQR